MSNVRTPESKLADLFAKTSNSVEFNSMLLASTIHKNSVHVQMQFIGTALDLLKSAKLSEAYGYDCSGIEDMLIIADSLGIDSGLETE